MFPMAKRWPTPAIAPPGAALWETQSVPDRREETTGPAAPVNRQTEPEEASPTTLAADRWRARGRAARGESRSASPLPAQIRRATDHIRRAKRMRAKRIRVHDENSPWSTPPG